MILGDKNVILLKLINMHIAKLVNSTMILVKNSKYFSNLLFCKSDLGFVVWWCCFFQKEAF